jgi:hypothetical protein
LPQQV